MNHDLQIESPAPRCGAETGLEETSCLSADYPEIAPNRPRTQDPSAYYPAPDEPQPATPNGKAINLDDIPDLSLGEDWHADGRSKDHIEPPPISAEAYFDLTDEEKREVARDAQGRPYGYWSWSQEAWNTYGRENPRTPIAGPPRERLEVNSGGFSRNRTHQGEQGPPAIIPPSLESLSAEFIWEPTGDPDDRRAGIAIFFGMRTHLQEPCGAGDVTLGRQCGKPSDAQFDSGRLLQFATFSKFCLGIQNLVEDLRNL